MDWLCTVCPELSTTRMVEGKAVEGINYSDLELVLGAVIRIPEEFKSGVFKDIMFAPDFLIGLADALGEDARFDTETPRMSPTVLARDLMDFAVRVLGPNDHEYTADDPEHYVKLVPTQAYDLDCEEAEGLTFGMLECPLSGRLGQGAAILTWFGCRYQPVARAGVAGAKGCVVETILMARKIFARKQPDKALLPDAQGGGSAFLAWVAERGHAVEARLDDVEPCRAPLRVVSALIDRLNYQEWSEAEKGAFLKPRLALLLRAYPLLRALIGAAADADAVRLILQLNNALLPTRLTILSAEAQVAEVEDALEVHEDRIEGMGIGGPGEIDAAQRVRTIIEIHTKYERAEKGKDQQGGVAAGEVVGLNKTLVLLFESQAFQDIAVSIGSFMAGPIGRDGKTKGKAPQPADTFLKLVATRYLILTRFLFGRVSLSMQVMQQAPFLMAVAKLRMTAVTVSEAKLVADALARVLLPRDVKTDEVHRCMLGFTFSLEECLKLVTGKWADIDWEVFLTHSTEAHRMHLTLDQYYTHKEAASGKDRAMPYTSQEEMVSLSESMKLVFDSVLGYAGEESSRRSFKGVMRLCLRALSAAASLPVQRCDILAKVNTCFHAALEDAGRNYARWLSLQGVDAAFPELWLPADSDALKALKLTMQTSAAVADHVTDLPFCAVQSNTNMSEKGASPPPPPRAV